MQVAGKRFSKNGHVLLPFQPKRWGINMGSAVIWFPSEKKFQEIGISGIAGIFEDRVEDAASIALKKDKQGQRLLLSKSEIMEGFFAVGEVVFYPDRKPAWTSHLSMSYFETLRSWCQGNIQTWNP